MINVSTATSATAWFLLLNRRVVENALSGDDAIVIDFAIPDHPGWILRRSAWWMDDCTRGLVGHWRSVGSDGEASIVDEAHNE